MFVRSSSKDKEANEHKQIINGGRLVNDVSMILFYIIGVNVLSFILMGMDKKKAEKRKYRVPERTFWMLAFLGGTIGVIFGMRIYRHKTKHVSFNIGMPSMILVNIILAGYLYNYLS